jgi:hypothetical protein
VSGTVITVAGPNRSYILKKKSQQFIEFPFIWLNNTKFVECRKSKFFIQNIHFAVPCILLSRAAAPFAPSEPSHCKSLVARAEQAEILFLGAHKSK